MCDNCTVIVINDVTPRNLFSCFLQMAPYTVYANMGKQTHFEEKAMHYMH